MVSAVNLLLLSCISFCSARDFIIRNNLGQTIWVGILGNAGKPPLNNGGIKLDPGQEVTTSSPDDWAGRFWARTGCQFDGSGIGPCETGDCGNKFECAGAGGVPPVSLAEITLNGWGGIDYYDISLVDGSNVPVSMFPMDAQPDPNNQFGCREAPCHADLNPNCPNELRLVNGAGVTVGCKSACLAFNTDEYCCRGAYGTPDTCLPQNWAYNYPQYFKDNCPLAYSYAYDDHTSTFTCSNTRYLITFG